MAMRGVERQNSVAVTSAMLGVFRDNARTRMEFLELVRRKDGGSHAEVTGLACMEE
jgi:GTP cyclohydrolase I